MSQIKETTTGHVHVNYLKENSLHLNTFKHHIYFDFFESIIPKASSYIMNNKQKSNKNCSYKMIIWTKEYKNNEYIANLLKLCKSKETAENIIVSMLLTDGHVYEKGNNIEIVYKGIDQELHQIFAGLIYEKYGITPNVFFKGYNEHGTIVYRTIFRNKELLKNLKKKSLTYHEYLSYKFRIEGVPIKKYRNNWREDFKKFIYNDTSYKKEEIIKFQRIFLALEKIEKRVSPNKFLKVIDYFENNKELDNKTFRYITGLKGIYSWSRCRVALKAYYKSNMIEEKDWRSYIAKLKEE